MKAGSGATRVPLIKATPSECMQVNCLAFLWQVQLNSSSESWGTFDDYTRMWINVSILRHDVSRPEEYNCTGCRRKRGHRPEIPQAWELLPFALNSPLQHPQQDNAVLVGVQPPAVGSIWARNSCHNKISKFINLHFLKFLILY